MKELSFPYQKALEAAIKASGVILHYYEKGFDSHLKTDGSPVTEADLASSKVILECLQITGIPVLGEESEHQSYEIRKNWKLNWCVDPLDGTKEYIKRNGEFAVNIALIDSGVPIFGVIAWPTQQRILFGGKETGVYITSFSQVFEKEQWQKIESQEAFNSPLVMAASRSFHCDASAEFMAELHKNHPEVKMVQRGSALKFFDLAEGLADIYPRFAPTMEWDIAAGQAILEALGGSVCKLDSGEPLHYNKENLLNPFFVAKTKAMLAVLFCWFVISGFAQNNLMPLHSFFKDRLYAPVKHQTPVTGSFLPLSENECDFFGRNADTTLQYYNFTEILFKHYLLEVKGEDFNFGVSPLLDLSKGRNYIDTSFTEYYQNTRGFLIEGDLLKSFSFSTSFYENQLTVLDYEKAYYNSVGELYPASGGGYATSNAVVPGAARTKPFKNSGYDFAYAVGNIVYKPCKQLQFALGNNSHFIGAGYRSLLLSDNSIVAPYLRINYAISKRLSFVYLRQKLTNLMRKPIKTTDEAYYETKGYSVNYLTYKPLDNLSISLFEGIIWEKGDSLRSHAVDGMFYNPVPFVAGFVISDTMEINALTGFNLEFAFLDHFRIYGQTVFSSRSSKGIAYQIGCRAYDLFNLKNLMLQVEYNEVPSSNYIAPNQRLNYSQYNLPLAHAKGNGFKELILRGNYEYKRFYLDYKTVLYQLIDYRQNALLPVSKDQVKLQHQIHLHQIELGYRFNRKINFTGFISGLNRVDFRKGGFVTNYISLGFRTALINHYNDF